MEYVTINELCEAMGLKNTVPEVDAGDKRLTVPEINRPALQLTGFYEHFAHNRIQVIGNVEYTYLNCLSKEEQLCSVEDFMSKEIPCVIFTNGNEPQDVVKKMAVKYNVPVFSSSKVTSLFTADLIGWLNAMLAPCVSVHGVLVDVYGEGVLIIGESGIGKSEAALELIRRGHRLVSDDVVELSRVSPVCLIGKAPDLTRDLIELRGIGVIDVKSLFGIECVEYDHSVDIVINLIEWDREKEKNFDRLGLIEEHREYLGLSIICHTIPVRPGRNLAVIVETAAVNHRQKKMGYNAAEELEKRVRQAIIENRTQRNAEKGFWNPIENQ